MLSKSELEALAEKYEAKAEKAFEHYQETGVSRYGREYQNADDLASALQMAAQASDDHAGLIRLEADISALAKKAQEALRDEKRAEAMEAALRSLVSFAVMEGLITDDKIPAFGS